MRRKMITLLALSAGGGLVTSCVASQVLDTIQLAFDIAGVWVN